MRLGKKFILFCLAGVYGAILPSVVVADQSQPPKLVLQITVDQLRGDLPFRYQQHFGAGGFRYLMDEGVWFGNAHHPHANTDTIVGHATLATGAMPRDHGMVGNVWFDRLDNRLAYNIEDSEFDIVGSAKTRDAAAEVDPTQVARSEGRSPRNLLVTTLSDEIALKGNQQAKVFSVAGKDRAAVAMGGHAGKSFWYSTHSGDFISSTYYYSAYPDWVDQWNSQKLADSYANTQWQLGENPERYRFAERDDRPYESNMPGYGRVFPHDFGPTPQQDPKTGKYFYTLLMASPVVDDLTINFAKAMIDNELIGQDSITDYLSVGLSSTDYVGHIFGPSSLEQEENINRLDQSLADLLQFVDERVGLENTLIILSSDHGVPEIPAYSSEFGVSAGTISVAEIKENIVSTLNQHYPDAEELLLDYFPPYVYLNRQAIKQRELDQGLIEQQLADSLSQLPGIGLAVSSQSLLANETPQDAVHAQILNNHNDTRSGDVYIAWAANWSPEAGGAAVAHSSPWRYDTHVPIVFAGYGIKPQQVGRRVETVDVVPTVTQLLKLREANAVAGKPLLEVLAR